MIMINGDVDDDNDASVLVDLKKFESVNTNIITTSSGS